MLYNFEEIFSQIIKPSDSKTTPNLTEEVIYSYTNKGALSVPVFSGATENEGVVGFVPYPSEDLSHISENSIHIENGIQYFINKTGCISVVGDGKAGVMFYRSPEQYPIFSTNISSYTLFGDLVPSAVRV